MLQLTFLDEIYVLFLFVQCLGCEWPLALLRLVHTFSFFSESVLTICKFHTFTVFSRIGIFYYPVLQYITQLQTRWMWILLKFMYWYRYHRRKINRWFWVHPISRQWFQLGPFHTLMGELMMDESKVLNYFRITTLVFISRSSLFISSGYLTIGIIIKEVTHTI